MPESRWELIGKLFFELRAYERRLTTCLDPKECRALMARYAVLRKKLEEVADGQG